MNLNLTNLLTYTYILYMYLNLNYKIYRVINVEIMEYSRTEIERNKN